MFFCTGVDRKNVLSLARKYTYIMTISVLQHSEKVLMSARNDSIDDLLHVRVWDKTRQLADRNVIGAWAGEVVLSHFVIIVALCNTCRTL